MIYIYFRHKIGRYVYQRGKHKLEVKEGQARQWLKVKKKRHKQCATEK